MELERAPVIGVVGPQADGRDVPFWDALADGRLLIQRCSACRTWIWPPRSNCPECLRFDPEWTDVTPRGRVFSWTRTWQQFTPEFAALVPYVTVLVELPGAGDRRLLGLLVGDDSVDPVIGEEVEGAIEPPSELTGGTAILRWRRVAAANP